ncbi:MAG: ABC transporter permease [Chloroflexi bacterium]|nr:ABC transporter permease [Chloroflexota bacterium]
MLKRVGGGGRPAVVVAAGPARVGLAVGPTLLRRAGALAVFVLIWHLASATGLVRPQIVPPPGIVFQTFLEMTADWSEFARHNLQLQLAMSAALSIARVLAGLAVGIAVGVTAGYLVGWYPLWAFPIEFVVRALRTIPGLAWVPLAIAWFGVAFTGPVFIVTLSALFPVAIATMHGVRTVNPVYIQSLRTLGADDRTIMRDVVLPGAVPSILTGVRVGLTIGWWSVIAAEMFGATGGLGFLIRYHGDATKMPEVMAGMIAVGLVNFALDRGYLAMQRRLLAWQGPREALAERGR